MVKEAKEPAKDRCPLCGGPNGCALARDPAAPVDACWCVSRTFPTSLLAKTRDSSSCICQACLVRETGAAPSDSA